MKIKDIAKSRATHEHKVGACIVAFTIVFALSLFAAATNAVYEGYKQQTRLSQEYVKKHFCTSHPEYPGCSDESPQ